MSIDKNLKELFSRYERTFMDYDGVDIKDVNQLGSGNDSLLHFAAFHSDCKDVELLLKHGANVNAKGDIGLTPLHYAASKGKLDIVKMLIQYGANKNIQNEFGETATDWARNNNQTEVVNFLSEI